MTALPAVSPLIHRPLTLIAGLMLALSAMPLAVRAQPPASVAEAAIQTYEIAPGPLAEALARFARQAGITLSFTPEQVRGRHSPGLRGRYAADAGLVALLSGTGLAARAGAEGYVLEAVPTAGGATTLLPGVKVTADAGVEPGALPLPFAGGEVARGGRLGLFGNGDYFDAPFSVTSYTSTAIENQQARRVADVLATDPAIRLTSSATDFEDTLMIRGFAVGASDISVNGLFGVLPLLSMEAASVERVEVFKGPSAFLNGMSPNGSVGGIVNLVPKRAADTPLTRLSLSHYSDSQLGTHLDLGRRFGADNAFGLRFNGVYRDGDTAIDANAERTRLATLGLDWRGKGLRASLDAGYQRRDVHGGNGLSLSLSGADIPDLPDAEQQLAPPWTFFENEDLYSQFGVEAELGAGITAHASYGVNRSEFRSLVTLADIDGDVLNYLPLATPQDYTRQGGEAGLRGQFVTGPIRHELSVAASYYNFTQSYLFAFFDPFSTTRDALEFPQRPDLTTLGKPEKWTNVRLGGVALGDTLHFAQDRVALTLGARLQQVRQSYYDGSGPNNNYDESAVSPVAGLLFKLRPGLSLYGNYIQGLSRGDVAPDEALNPGALPPYKTRQIEAGLKYERGSFATTLAVFQIKKPAAALDADLLFRLIGEQRNRGVELSLFGEPRPGLRLRGGVTVLDASLHKSADGENEGKDIAAVPGLQANLNGEWDLPFLPALSLNAGVAHTGRTYLDDANTLKLPDWTTFDLGARYRLVAADTPLTLRASVENLGNEAYWFSTSGGYGLNLGKPRTLLLSVTADF